MRSVGLALVVACTVLVVGCAGPGADAPEDASIESFCAAKSWMVVEGTDRFFADGLPSDDELVRTGPRLGSRAGPRGDTGQHVA